MIEAVYPGTFDPVTHGHLDLIDRGARRFERLIVSVAAHSSKTPVFALEERVEMIDELVQPYDNVTVEAFDGLVVNYVRERGCSVIFRGLRTVSDFEYEHTMALTNRTLAPDIETVFLMPSPQYSFVSSRLIKEIMTAGGDVSGFVPDAVARRLADRLERNRKG